MITNRARFGAVDGLRAGLLAALFALVAIAGLFQPAPVQAQTVGLSKTLCTTQPVAGDSTACNAGVAQAFTAVWYKVVLDNTGGSAATIALTESYPSNFQFVGVTCATSNGAGVTATTGTSGTPISVSAPAGQIVTCIISGYFTGSGSANNTVSSGSATQQWNATVPSPTTLPTDLSIAKTSSVTQVDISGAPATIQYTITITNNGANAVYLGQLLTIRDSMSLYSNGVPLNVGYVSGSSTCTSTAGANCVSTTPTYSGPPPLSGNYTPFLQWKFPTTGANAGGYIPVGGTITLTYTVQVSRNPLINCIRQPGSDGIQNKAELILDPPGPVTSMVDVNTSNNSATTGVSANTGITAVDPLCGQWGNPSPLKITKVQTTLPVGGGFAWGTTVFYKITLQNTSNQVLTGVQLSDFVMAIPGSPTFIAERPQPVVFASGCIITSNTTAPASQTVNNYYTPAPMWSATLIMPANSTCTVIAIRIVYKTPGCDAFTNNNNPIRNTARATWTGTWNSPPNGSPPITGAFVAEDSNDVNGVLVDTLMAAGPACKLRVTKIADPATAGPIRFGVSSSYRVNFTNAENFAVPVGTLYDAIRIVQPNYATGLTVSYVYNCAPVAGITNAPTSGSGVTVAVYTQYPHQGARIINGGGPSGPVVFGPGKTLQCLVEIKVDQPPPGGPYCLSAVQPELENTALMTTPGAYSSNGPWPPEGVYDGVWPYPATQPDPQIVSWATVIKPLPRCFNLQVNKTVTPTVTWTTSSTPETYTITVQNLGDAFTSTGSTPADWDGPVLKDTFVTSIAGLSTTFVSLTPTNCCVWLTPPPTPAVGTPLDSPTFLLGIKSLAAAGQPGSTLTLTFKLNPGPYVQPKIGNEAMVYRTKAHPNWYANDSRSCYPTSGPPYTTIPANNSYQRVMGSCARVEVPVRGVGKIKIIKVVNNTTGAPTPGMFDMTLNCTFNGQALTPSQHFVAPGATGVIRNNIPETSLCSVTEAPLPYVPVAPNCSNGASWSVAIAGQPATVVANATKTITVTNTLACTPPGPGLTIVKQIVHPSTGSPAGNLLTGPAPVFAINVACADGFTAAITLTDGMSQTLTGPTVGTSCTVTETLPPGPFSGNCPILMNWMPPTITPGQPVTIGANGTTVTVSNTYRCITPFGTLTIKKVLIDFVSSPTTPPYMVQLSCGWPNMAPSFLRTLTLGGTQSLQNTQNQIPLGMTCTVVESPPVQPPSWSPPCRWLTTYPGSNTPNLQHLATVTSTPQTLIIQNEQTCSTVNSPTDSELKVRKEVRINGMVGQFASSPLTFNLTLNCSGQSQQTLPLTTSSLGVAGTSYSLPAGTVCTVNEASQGPLPALPSSCSWTGLSYYWSESMLGGGSGTGPTVTLTQAQRQYILTVRNSLTCTNPAPPPPGGGGGGDRRSTTITPPPLTPPPPPRDDRPPTAVADGSRPVDGVSINIGRTDGGSAVALRTDGEGRAPGTRLQPGVYRVILDPVSLTKGLTGMPGVKMTGGRPPISIGVGIGGSSGSGGSRDDRGRGGGSGGGGGVSIGIPLGGSAPKPAAVPGAAVVVTVTVDGRSTETRLPCCEKRDFDTAAPIYVTISPGAGPVIVAVRYAPPPKKR